MSSIHALVLRCVSCAPESGVNLLGSGGCEVGRCDKRVEERHDALAGKCDAKAMVPGVGVVRMTEAASVTLARGNPASG